MKVPGIPFVQGRNSSTDPDGTKYGIAIHNTSNDASDTSEAQNGTHRTDKVSSHFYVDRDSVTQSLDTAVKAWHSGSDNGNNHAISIEITGTNDKTRAWWLANVAWDRLGAVLAVLCKTYGITPRRASVAEMKANPKVKAFYGHDDMRQAWGGTTHTDPGPTFPWDRLFQAVNAALNPLQEDDVTAQDVWNYPVAQGDSDTKWAANTVLSDTRRLAVQIEQAVGQRTNELKTQVADLKAQIGALAITGVPVTVDYDVLAAKVADLLAGRLAS